MTVIVSPTLDSLYGVDLSSHNGIPDGAALARAGYQFAIIKYSGGATYRNPLATQQAAAVRAAGLLVAGYHYDGEPTVGVGTPAEECENFTRSLPATLPAGWFPALDCEERATRDPARYLAWLQAVERTTLRRPLVYTYQSFVTERPELPWSLLAGYGLWLASYPGDPPQPGGPATPPTPPAPWRTVVIWQYSGGGAVPGLTVPTDQDVFFGSRAALAALGAIGGLVSGDERVALLADANAIPVFARGSLIREGIADLTVFGGGQSERIALYEKQYFHRINGTTQTFFRDPAFPGSYAALHAAGHITLYGDGPDIAQ